MMEHTTDRLFWTLSAIIIAALLLTIGVKVFPKAASEVIHPMSGVVQQADTVTQATKDAADNIDNQTGTNTTDTAWNVNTPTITNNTSASSNNANNGVSADQFNSLASLVDSLKQQVSSDRLNIAQLNTNLNQANNTNDQLNTKLNNALNQMQSSNNNASSDTLAKIKAANDSLYNQLNSMNQNYQTQGQQYASQIDAIKQQLADAQKAQSQTNQNAANNSTVTNQLTQQLSSTQNALKQLATTVSANNAQAQNIYNQYQAQIQQLGNNVTDAQNNAASAQVTANNASNAAQSNAANIVTNSQNAANAQSVANNANASASLANNIAENASNAASNANVTAQNASNTATNAQSTANNASNSANAAQTTANNATTAVNNVFQSRSHVFTNNESLYDAFGMQDGYYSVSASTSEAPSNFSGTGILSVYNNNGQTYLVLVDSNGNTTWTANASTSNPSMSWSGWTQQAKSSDVANNTSLITTLQSQFNYLNQNTLTVKGNIGNQDLNTVTQTGIYTTNGNLGANMPSGDWNATLIVTNLNNAPNGGGDMITQNLITEDGPTDGGLQNWVRIQTNGVWKGWIRSDGGAQQAILGDGSSILDPVSYHWPDGVYKVNGTSRDMPVGWAGQRWGFVIKSSYNGDEMLEFHDAQWNAVYVNYLRVYGWSGWRELTDK